MYLNITNNNQRTKKKKKISLFKNKSIFGVLYFTNMGVLTIRIKLQIVQIRCVCYITING